MKSTPLTQGIAFLLLVVFVAYSFFALPFAGFLLSLAIGMITFGGTNSFEVAVSATLLGGVMYSLISKSKEGFADQGTTIVERIKNIKQVVGSKGEVTGPAPSVLGRQGPKGVFASGFVEGFADAADGVVTAGSDVPPNPTNAEAASKPATASAPPPTIETPAISGFKGDTTNGLFKLGVLPEEKKGGFHIDQGTTVMNALNSLKPDQIKAMSEDTQKLIDTQKSLMSMLSTMKPMLQDGKQMMETFQQMFGKDAGQFKL